MQRTERRHVLDLDASQKRKRMPFDERRASIIAAATDFVAQHGFNYTTRQLAEHLGITQPLLYRYFQNKQDLIDCVYEEVYQNRSTVAWREILEDRTRPLHDRLVDYLTIYTSEILDEKWIRIFMIGALTGSNIHTRFIGFLTREVFPTIAKEIRLAYGLAAPKNSYERKLQIEIIWGFHSSFFYVGVRRWIYRLPVPLDMGMLIEQRVGAFLNGAAAAFAAAAVPGPEAPAVAPAAVRAAGRKPARTPAIGRRDRMGRDRSAHPQKA